MEMFELGLLSWADLREQLSQLRGDSQEDGEDDQADESRVRP
jgi:hypothetical protein